MLLLYATMAREEAREMIGIVLGEDSPPFREFLTERNLRVRSMYVVDAFSAMMKQVGEVPLTGRAFEDHG